MPPKSGLFRFFHNTMLIKMIMFHFTTPPPPGEGFWITLRPYIVLPANQGHRELEWAGAITIQDDSAPESSKHGHHDYSCTVESSSVFVFQK